MGFPAGRGGGDGAGDWAWSGEMKPWAAMIRERLTRRVWEGAFMGESWEGWDGGRA